MVKTQGERLAMIEQKIDDFVKSNTEQHDDLKSIIIELKQNKADKWVEKAIWGFVIYALTTMIAIIAYGIKLLL